MNKKIYIYLFLLLSGSLLYMCYAGIVEEIAGQKANIEGQAQQLKNLITTLQQTYDGLEASNNQLQTAIDTTLQPTLDSITSTGSYLEKVPDILLDMFDPKRLSGIADTKKALTLMDTALQGTKLVLTGIKASFVPSLTALNYKQTDPQGIYAQLNDAVSLMQSAAGDLAEMEAFITALLKNLPVTPSTPAQK